MEEAKLIYNLLFILFTYCLVYPATEIITLGLTLNRLFAEWLGSEEMEFIQYHRKRTTLNVCCHSLLPAIYLAFYTFQFGTTIIEYKIDNFIIFMAWNSIIVAAIGLPILATSLSIYWYLDDWKRHPLSRVLVKYSNQEQDWPQVGANINDEFRRHDIIIRKTNAIISVIATENWIIKISPYLVYVAHQSDTALIAINSDTHPISEDSSESIQFVNILVKPTRPGVEPFSIRINALDFKDLQDRINRPIAILSGVQFNRSIIERFVDVFKEQIALNPTYRTEQISESCFACMQSIPNIKLQKQCLDVDVNNVPLADSQCCGNCYCRPMWCATCLAKWFASKQNEYEKEVWLEQKCTCPMCRAKFCILDVCYVVGE